MDWDVKMPHVEKLLARKLIFVQTPFSHYFKNRVTKVQNHQLFRSISCLFRHYKNHYSNLPSKVIKMCDQILNKDSSPIQFKFIELKKPRRPIIASAFALRQLKKRFKKVGFVNR